MSEFQLTAARRRLAACALRLPQKPSEVRHALTQFSDGHRRHRDSGCTHRPLERHSASCPYRSYLPSDNAPTPRFRDCGYRFPASGFGIAHPAPIHGFCSLPHLHHLQGCCLRVLFVFKFSRQHHIPRHLKAVFVKDVKFFLLHVGKAD